MLSTRPRPVACRLEPDDPSACYRKCFDSCVNSKRAKRLYRRTERMCKGLEPQYTLCMLEKRSDRVCRKSVEMKACMDRLAILPSWLRRLQAGVQEDLCPEGACKARCLAGHKSRDACESISGCGWTLTSSEYGDETTSGVACAYLGQEVGPLFAKCQQHCEALKLSTPVDVGQRCNTYNTACCYETDRPKQGIGRCRKGLRCVRDPDSEDPDRWSGTCQCPAHKQETSYCCPILHADQPVEEQALD